MMYEIGRGFGLLSGLIARAMLAGFEAFGAGYRDGFLRTGPESEGSGFGPLTLEDGPPPPD